MCISAVLQWDSDITLHVRLLTGFPSAWLPNVTSALRIPISSPPQLEILENNLPQPPPLPSLPPPPPSPPSPFSDRTGQNWTKTFHQQGSYIHPDRSGAPRYVTGFWSILACLQKEFTCRSVRWKSGKVADELMDFSPLEQSEAKNPSNISIPPTTSSTTPTPSSVQLSKSSRQYFTTLTSIIFYYQPNVDTNRVNIRLSKQNRSDPGVQVCVVSQLHKHKHKQ